MTYTLIQAGHRIAGGAWQGEENLKCMVCRARVLRRMNELESAEGLCREAIKGFKASENDKCGLECQLLLADILGDLNRDFDALRVLLVPYVNIKSRLWNKPVALVVNQKMLELLDGVQKINSRIESGESLASVTSIISNMKKAHESWNCTLSCLDPWFELVQLGAHYSKSAEFGLADLCFSYPHPRGIWITSWTTRERLAQIRKELCLHYKRQWNRRDCNRQLEMAFQQLLRLETDHGGIINEDPEKDGTKLLTILEQLLDQTCPKIPARVDDVVNYSEAKRVWDDAQEACEMLTSHRLSQPYWLPRLQIPPEGQTKSVSNDLGGPISLSSNGSSLLSRGSMNSRFGLTYSVGSASSIVSNSVFMVP